MSDEQENEQVAAADEEKSNADEGNNDKPKADKPKADKPKAGKPKADKSKKDKPKAGKGKKGKSKGKGKGDSAGVSIATHPRAAAQVRRAKGWGGTAGFMIGGYLSYQAGVGLPMVILRAVAVGIASYMVVWFCALTIWRQMVLAELRAMSEPPKPARGGADGSDERA
jgi:hypothetical protein